MNIGRFLDRAAEKDPHKIYLYSKGSSVSYFEFVKSVAGAAQGFLDLGVSKGDRVCLMLPNCPEFLYAWLGLAKIGAIPVFVNTAFKESEIQYIANHSEATAIVATSEMLPVIERIRTELLYIQHPVIMADDGNPPQTLCLREMMSSHPAKEESPQVSPDDVASFIYTSGTTGMPKAVMQTHRTYVLTGQAFPCWLHLTDVDRLFTCLPLFHINAQAYSVMGSLGAGAALVLAHKFSAGSFWDQIRASRATQLNLIGAMPLFLLKQPAQPTDREHSVRVVYSAPALDPHAHEEFEKRFGVTLTIGYGLSESTFGCINPIEKSRRRLGSIGLSRSHPDPRFSNHLKIVGENGEELEPGQPGEIVLRNPTLMKGYLKDAEATQNSLQGGWLFTGDLAYQDSDGFIYFAGRKKDMIRRKGENISAHEVERVLEQHPYVLESAVIGLPTDIGDEQVVAYIVPSRKGYQISAAELIEWCKKQLASFKVPETVEIRESLPKTSTNKIAKYLLKTEQMNREAKGL